MRLTKKNHLGICIGIFLVLILVGCGSGKKNNTPDNTSSENAEADAGDASVTTIVIDGEADDWVDRPLLHEDAAGDAEGDYLDITRVFAFLNQNSLYILVEVANPGANFEQFDFEISADGQRHLITWHKTMDYFGQNRDSIFVSGSVVEGKIDLDDLGSPEGLVAIAQIRVMAGDTPPSETWRAVDEFNPRMQGLTWVNEVDETKESDTAIQNPAADEPPSEEPSQPAPHNFKSDTPLEERAKYVWLEERGEYAEYIYRQFHQNAQQVAWGPDGYLYIADGAGKHIVRVAPDGTLDDLGIWKDHIYMQEYGPNGIAFDLEGNLLFNTGPHMYKRSPDGTIEYLFSAEHGNIRNITVDEKGVMYYSLNTGPIYQWNPDGEDIFLTDEYHDPQIYMAPNGQLYISDYGMNRVIVFDVNTKESRVFAEGLFGPEGTYLRVDPEGDLWARGTPFGYQFSPEGELKPFTIDGQPSEYFRWHLAGDITFDPDGNLWVTYASGEILRLTPDTPGQPDPNSFTSEIISESFEASDLAIGPEGEVYATNLVPGNIWRFNPDGSHEIIWQHGDQGRVGIAVDDQGVIYAGAIFGEILKWENGTISRYASDLYTERLIIAGDGNLYAASGKYWENEPSKIVRITGVDTYEVVATEIDGVSFGTSPIQIKPAMKDGLYVINQSDGTLYYMDFEGNGYPLIQLANETQFSILASSPVTGKVYFISHLVIEGNAIIQKYSLYEYEPGGELKMIAPVVPGDPWDMEVSADGKWLYIIEVGAMDIIPLDASAP